MPIWDFGGMSSPKDQCMFFSNGHPSCQGSSYPFATTTANFPNTRFVYSYKKSATLLVDTDLYHQKLDRILDLLQDQHYSELNKIMGTMTINEVASYLSKSVRTIERRIAKGFLKAAYKEGNADLFLKKDVVELYIIEYKKWPRLMP